METSLTNTCCNGCETFKALYEFMGHGANEINNNQPNILEVIDIDFLSEVITILLEDTPSNNQELH
ncbi:11928_t:CDS:2 [Rhizophagus irregularis]|nr:11928_t:CDS:2 [Rhizophagus irregularis]